MWHASVAPVRRKMHPRELKAKALAVLGGVGDRRLGEWHEWTGRAYHLRRRLSAAEQAEVGDVVDCRGTDEWQRRFDAVKDAVPAAALRLALAEKRGTAHE